MCGRLRGFAGPELIGEQSPRVPQVRPAGDALELPVHPDERSEVGLQTLVPPLLEHADVPRARVDSLLVHEQERTVAELRSRGVEPLHAWAIGTVPAPFEAVPPDGVAEASAHFAVVRPPTVIEPGRLIAGRHPCAWGSENASAEVAELAAAGVTLFLDLTQSGELEPYASHVEPPARYVNRPIRDFSIPARDALVATLDEIDAEIDSGGLVYVHCWAGCGRTGVVVGTWLVRHGVAPNEALRRIADARGLGCPQTLEQRVYVLDWRRGL
jgi:protein-tyrosine phosphatase